MKNKIQLVLLIFILGLLFGCNKNIITEPNQINNLEGSWSCTFAYKPEMQFPEYEITDTLLSLIEFDKDSFTLIIDRPNSIFPERKYSSQTIIYTGSYSIINDKLILYVSNEKPFMEDFIYLIKRDSLSINVAPSPDNPFAIRMNSFLWNYKMKHSGIFIKVKNR